MKKLFFLSMALLMITAISMGFSDSVTTANDTGAGLFTDSIQAGSLDTSTVAVRSRYVDVDFDVLGAAWAKRGDVLELNLFNDVSFKAVLKTVKRVSPKGFAYVGKLQGVGLSSVTMVVEDGLIAANIVFPGGAYQVRYAGGGVHVVYEVDHSAYPPEAEPIPADLPADAGTDDVSAEAVTLVKGSQIEVLVVYTDDARAAAGGTTAMNTLINLAITETNTSYTNSGITQRVRLAHAEEVSYDESGFNWNTTLSRLTNTSDGFIDNVHTLRDTYKADEVVLLVADNGYCGMAWLMTTVSNAFKTKAFALVNWDCATGYYSFGHELGHNMGARHDWYIDDAKNSPYTYNHGYVNPGTTSQTRWRTVMAYNNECSDRGFSCTRIPYWSNPRKKYGGIKMGVASKTNSTCTAGNLNHPKCDADNHLVLNKTAKTVAGFR
ncbi:MAG TPA: M12 family metallo-peptidase [Candidatus Brocadiaceae bacterium]|nr:M12 family metallo-peptidase [Candidatus Brocadiaceae bacterium]